MLHMIVNTHAPESCAFRSEANRDALLGGLTALSEAATAAGASLEGAWANRAAHTAFALIEAPDAHTVDEIVGTAGLIGWTDSRVFAVATLEQVAESVRTSTS